MPAAPSHLDHRPPLLRCEVQRQPGSPARVVAQGELDLATVGIFDRACEAFEPTSEAVEVDLGGVSFLDGAGLGCLLAAWRRLDAGGSRTTLVAAGPWVVWLLELTGTQALLGWPPVVVPPRAIA